MMIKIFLLGMMGSGKTYWAERLKKKLKIPAYDLDALIEMMEEKTINEIFSDDGEEAFRKAEAKMLRLFAEKNQFILACGGGTACYGDNINWMNKHGLTLWIDERAEILVKRLSQEKTNRPAIKDMDENTLAEWVGKKLVERKKFYSLAAHRLSGEQLTENNMVKIIKQYA